MKKLFGMIVLSLCVFNCVNVNAQKSSTEPSLEETMNWLGAKLTDKSLTELIRFNDDYNIIHFGFSHPKLDPEFKVDKCTLTLSQPSYDNISELTTFNTLIIPFNDIDPLRVSPKSNCSSINKLDVSLEMMFFLFCI